MSDYKSQPFFKLALRFGMIFLVVITLIKIVGAIFSKGGFDGMIQEYFSATTWQQFAKIQLAISALYGLFMAGYYKFIKKN
jgi:hypothetical protein